MYSRSFYSEPDEVLRPPENYDGNAFNEKNMQLLQSKNTNVPEESNPDTVKTDAEPPPRKQGIFSSLFPIQSLTGLFGSKETGALSPIKMPSIGTEELLILAAAAYLFFSKNGDKECAILLILLIFVN